MAVEVAIVGRGSIEESLRLVGDIRAAESVDMASQVAGRIASVAVRMGQRVIPGQVLVQIDDAHIRTQLLEAEAALSVARASLQRAEVQFGNAASELARKEPLAAQDLVSRQELDNARARHAAEAASLELAKAQVGQSTARVELLEQQLADARIRAPLPGWVKERRLDPGAVVAPGTPILRLIRADPAVAHFKVGERHVGLITDKLAATERLPVDVEVDAHPGETFRGHIARVAPALDEATRSVAVEAEIANRLGRLLPGMYCRVVLRLGRRSNVLLLPARALLGGSGAAPSAAGGQASVYVVEQDRAQKVSVTVGRTSRDRVEVVEGLQEGAQVVVHGMSALKEGSVVDVVATRPAPPAAEQPPPDRTPAPEPNGDRDRDRDRAGAAAP